MAKQAYKNLTTVVNEHIVRAREAHVEPKRHGEEAMRQEIAKDTKRSFVHLQGLCDAVARYEADRSH